MPHVQVNLPRHQAGTSRSASHPLAQVVIGLNVKLKKREVASRRKSSQPITGSAGLKSASAMVAEKFRHKIIDEKQKNLEFVY
jgi:hypothetical protein